MTQPTFTEATPTQRAAMLKVANDLTIQNRRAEEIRVDILAEVEQSLTKLSIDDLGRALSEATAPLKATTPFWNTKGAA